MAPILRRFSESERHRVAGKMFRRQLALALALFSAVLGAWLFNHDTEWEMRQHEASTRGMAAAKNSNFKVAQRLFEIAIANNPYDWESHLSLARILNHVRNNYADALKHYLLAMAYSPDSGIQKPVTQHIHILRLIQNGELESPVNALEDMFLAVEAGAKNSFYSRLSPALLEHAEAYWDAWTTRGRGTIIFTRINEQKSGSFDSVVELRFEDGTVMALHMQCTLRGLWRIEVSFP